VGKTVEFHPPTPELREEAVRFFNTANGLNADGSLNPALQPPLSTRTVEETRLIRAILDSRDAEQPYIDYAAWLSAKGDAYGDFIRLTLEIEKLSEGDKQRERQEVRLEKLVAKHGPRWVLPLANIGIYPGVYIGGIDGYYPTIFHNKKGVIEELNIDRDALVFPANAPRLFYGAPFLRKLSISHSALTLAEFAAIPQFAQLESLSLSVASGTADDARRFAESPHLSALRELNLSGCHIGSDAVAHLARAAWLAGVRSLDLGSNALGDDGAEALAESPQVANLTALDLRYNDLTDRGLIALCRSPHFAQLTTLNLESNTFTAEGIRALVAAPFARTLTSLNLSGTQLDADALRVLATGAFPALTALNITYCRATDESVQAIVAASFFRTLEVFQANSTGAGDATAGAIAAHGFVPLRELELAGNALTDAGVEALVRSKAVTKLTKLNLNENPFGLAGTKALADTNLPKLEHLDLCRVSCGPAGAKALAASPHFKGLKKFWISEEHTGLAGREALLKRFTDDVMMFMT
jgi:Ran GTPase-activating protein (RanGAP) involved in mRNA processing and transport